MASALLAEPVGGRSCRGGWRKICSGPQTLDRGVCGEVEVKKICGQRAAVRG